MKEPKQKYIFLSNLNSNTEIAPDLIKDFCKEVDHNYTDHIALGKQGATVDMTFGHQLYDTLTKALGIWFF